MTLLPYLCGLAFFFLFAWCLVAAASEGDRPALVGECSVCGGPCIDGETLCAVHRTAWTTAGETFEEWRVDRTTPVVWRRF